MAYAALNSILYTISEFLKSDDIQIVQNSSPEMIELLLEEVFSLGEVIEELDSNMRRFSSRRLHSLDAKITEAVFKLEDVVEFHLLDQFLSQCSQIQKHPSPSIFSLDIEELKQEIDSLIQSLDKMKMEYTHELSSNNLPIYEEEKEEDDADDADADADDDDIIVKTEPRMLGILCNKKFMAIKEWMLRAISGFDRFALWGMAGIGKTTLARKLFEDPSISSHYDGSRAFVTVGPEYKLEDIYLDILKQLDPHSIDDEGIMLLREGDDQEKLGLLETMLNECLKDRRYLIVLDDVWDYVITESECFKSSSHGSMVIVTTRLGSFATKMRHWNIPFLDKKESWDLLCANVFGEEESHLCSSELKRAGKKIAENCEGLPLTIVTVANILSKHERTPEHWNRVAANKQHCVYVEAYAKMHKVLLPSYYYLPQYLRIAFLYMGVFPQNHEIACANLYMLWRAEGYLQLGKSLMKEDHFKKLLNNSLLLVHSTASIGTYKTVSLHSSFWYLIKKEAGKSKFFHSFTTLDDCFAQSIENQRRLCVYNPVLFAIEDAFDKMTSISAARSLLCTGPYHQYPVPICFGLRLLRVLHALAIHFYEFPMEVLKLIHLTYFALTFDGDLPAASISKLWNLKYLIVGRRLSIKSSDGAPSYLPVDIWEMKKLEQLQVMGSDLPEPREGSLIMLVKLLDVSPHSCTQRILERVPNLSKLRIRIELSPDDQPLGYCSDHIRNIHKLMSFKCVVVNPRIMSEVAAPPPLPLPIFPKYLEKLTLSGLGYPWEEMSNISSLAYLKVLKLLNYAFRGPKWHIQDKDFPNLQVLMIEETDLVHWTIKDGYHIEYLRFLSIKHCYDLKEIPMGLVTLSLKKIQVVDCNTLVLPSANKLKEDWDRRYKGKYRRSGLDLDVQSSWDDHKI